MKSIGVMAINENVSALIEISAGYQTKAERRRRKKAWLAKAVAINKLKG
jgi:hypothetical protein